MRSIAFAAMGTENCRRITTLSPRTLSNTVGSQVTLIQSPLERENLIKRIRQHGDILYPWGRTRRVEKS